MPLTPEQKVKFLQSKGLNPDEYDVDEYTPEEYAKFVNPPAPVVAPALTQGQAFGARLKRAVAPALTALPGISYGAELGSVGGPIGSVVGGVLGGLGAGYLGAKVQEPVIKALQTPDEYQKGVERYEQAAQQFPKTSVLADVAPNFLAFSPGGLGNVVKGVGKLAFPSRYLAAAEGMQPTISAAEKAAMGTAAINTAVNAGSEAIKQGVSEDGPMDYGRVATAGALGLLQNKPYGPIGNRLFPTPVTPHSPLIEQPPLDVLQAPASKPAEVVNSNIAKKAEVPVSPVANDELASMKGEVKPSYTDDTNQVVKTGIPELRPDESPDYVSDPTARFYQEGKKKSVPAPGLGGEPILQIKDDFTNVDTEGSLNTWFRSVEDVDRIAKGKKFVKDGPQYDSQGNRYLSEQGEGRPISDTDRQTAQELAAKRGVTLRQPSEIISGVSDKPARGYSEPSSRVAAISDIATSDTPYHEIGGHQHLEDLLASAHPEDVNFANRGLQAAGSKEALAEAVGNRAVEVKNKPLRSWLEDFWSNVKRTVNAGGNEDDIKLFTRRALDDRPYAESPELQNVASSNVSPEARNLATRFYSEVGQDNSASAKQTEPSKGLIPSLTPVVDKLKAKGGADKIAGEAYEKFEKQLNRNIGEFTNPFIAATKKIKDKEKAARYIWESVVNGDTSGKGLSPQDKGVIDSEVFPIYKKVQDVSNAEGVLVKDADGNWRQAIHNPNRRGPLMPSDKVIDILVEHPSSSIDRRRAEQQFIDFHTKQVPEGSRVSPEEAKAMLNDYLRGLASAKGGKGATPDFNALRRAEGVGIPWEWMEKDPVKLFQRYGNRVSRDLAFFKHVQNVPEVRNVFGFPSQTGEGVSSGERPAIGGDVDLVKRRMSGQHTTSETIYNAVEHFTRSLILGPVSGVKNLVGTLPQLLPYVPVKDIPKIAEALKYVSKGLEDGLAKGVIRHSTTSMEVGSTSEGFGNLADSLKTWGDAIRHYTGANKIEQISRAHTMAVGELLTRSYAGRALAGDIDAIKFLKQFAPEGVNLKALTEDAVKETAANFTERVQGTYGGRGLPRGLLEPSSPAYWLLSLNKWGIEKANVIKQDVINPALKGDIAPLVRYTLGGLATGELISQITQALYNKKSSSPNLTELQDSGKAEDYAYKATELMWLSGVGGIMSDVAKAAMDKVKPYGRSNAPTIPSAEIAKSIAEDIANASAAIADGQNPVDIVLQLSNDILVQNIQALRVAYNQTLGKEDLQRADMFRDKRVKDRLDGKNLGEMPSDVNNYEGLDKKKFKKSGSVEEGKKIYEEDIKPRLEKMTPEEAKREKKGLKENSFQVAPSDWRESEEYYAYIKRTQGEEAAKRLREVKGKQDKVNREKSWLVR